MKIALVGKGGTWKSSMSWLLTHHLLALGKKVLAIDSDHNMDFTDLLWHQFSSNTPTFKTQHGEIYRHLEETEWTYVSEVIQKHLGHYKFHLDPLDSFSENVLIPLQENLLLWVVGLWASDVMWWWYCAHGLSNPLKIYITMLQEGPYDVVVDGVAGVDMINFGLYHACDVLYVVVEPTRNSTRVAKQITDMCDLSLVNYGVIVNKAQENTYMDNLRQEYGDQILMEVPYDEGIFSYQYDQVSKHIKEAMDGIFTHAQQFMHTNLVQRMLMLHELREVPKMKKNAS